MVKKKQETEKEITVFDFHSDSTLNCRVIHLPLSVTKPKGACDSDHSTLEEHIYTHIPPSALNHNLPLEFISHQTSNSSTQSNKKLNPATHSWEVKPSLSSDSSGREGWRSCAKSNQACSQAASDSYWHLFLEISSAILFEPRGSTSFGTFNSSWCSFPEKVQCVASSVSTLLIRKKCSWV